MEARLIFPVTTRRPLTALSIISRSSLATHSTIPLVLVAKRHIWSVTVPTVKAFVPFFTLTVDTDAGEATLVFVGVNDVPVAPAELVLTIRNSAITSETVVCGNERHTLFSNTDTFAGGRISI